MSPVMQGSINDTNEKPFCPGFGRTALAMAALRRRKAIWISRVHLCCSDFADICCPFRLEAMSAAY